MAKGPDIDFIVGLIFGSRLTPKDIERRTSELGRRVSPDTIRGWLEHSDSQPLNLTVTTVALALGYVKTWELASEQPQKPTSSRPPAGTYIH